MFEVTPQILDLDQLTIDMGGTTKYVIQSPKHPMVGKKMYYKVV
jgi:hypothetical protein